MAIVGKIVKGETIPLLLSEHFENDNPHNLAHGMCKWVNADDEQVKNVTSVTMTWDQSIQRFVGIVFYLTR